MSCIQGNLWPDEVPTDPINIAKIYNVAAQTYGDDSLKDGWTSSFNLLNKELHSLLTSPKSHVKVNVLDAGCGDGLLGDRIDFRKYDVNLYGIDLAAEMISVAERKNKYDHLKIGSLTETLPFADNFFDVVIANGVLGYCENSEPIHNIMHVLKPGGHLVITMREHHFVDRGYPQTLREMDGQCKLIKLIPFSAFPNNPEFKHKYNFYLIKKL